MSSEQIHLAIPHYNAPKLLDTLLTTAETMGFDSITVLDDASDDHATLQAVAGRHAAATFIYGDTNLGA